MRRFLNDLIRVTNFMAQTLLHLHRPRLPDPGTVRRAPLRGRRVPVVSSLRVLRVPVDENESRRANRRDGDRYADESQSTHDEFLVAAGFVWGPAGLPGASVRVLCQVRAMDVPQAGP